MIDIGCFETVARGEAYTGSVSFTPSPHPEIAEQQALQFGLFPSRTANVGSSGRSPYPSVVEKQFELGIK